MTVRSHSIFAAASVAAGGAIAGAIVFLTDPAIAGPEIFIVFYTALALFLFGLAYLPLFYAKKKIFKKSFAKIARNSSRQAAEFALISAFFLFMQGLRLLRPWNMALLATSLAIMEGFFLTKNR